MSDQIDDILTRGVANIIPAKDDLRRALETRKLNIYLGIDPTATRIHLGHAFPLRKLQKLADAGHNVTFLIGDFTALIGDTSDKDTERPVLTSEQIEENFKTYKKQAEKIIDFSRVTVRKNSEWLSKLTFKDIVELTQKFSLNDFISRELIKKRLNEGKSVRLDETLYPIMQGYDSYFMDTDLQLGGTDQTFNMQAGRTLQKLIRNKESFVLATEFLAGTDGRKMSKSWGNAIWLDDEPHDIFGKVMSVSDEVILDYFLFGTDISQEEIKAIERRLKDGENPIKIKKELAFLIVSELHNEKKAEEAREFFEKTVQNKELPSEIPALEINESEHITVSDFLVKANLVSSRSEAKRLIEQGGMSINGETVKTANEEIIPEENMIIKGGKRNFIKIKLANGR